MDRQRLEELCAQIERIAGLVSADPEGADEAIDSFNTRTGHEYGVHSFATYHGSTSLEEFATEAARPARPVVADVTRDELAEIVRRLRDGHPESDYYLRLLEANVPHPRVSDLLHHPPEHLQDASAERIVDEALGYRPIEL